MLARSKEQKAWSQTILEGGCTLTLSGPRTIVTVSRAVEPMAGCTISHLKVMTGSPRGHIEVKLARQMKKTLFFITYTSICDTGNY